MQRERRLWYTVTMLLLWSLFICLGLWLLFPKGFKFVVGSLVGSCGAMFFWGLAVVAWCMAVGLPSWAGMGWSMLAFLVIGNVSGCVLAAKG